jgi:hypothetical protein
MDFFGATSPGAITASMRPTTPKQVGAGEEKYEFNKKANPIPPVMGGGAGSAGAGGGNLGGDFGFGNFDLSYLNDLNDRFGRMEDRVFNPDYSSINDRFGQLEGRFGEQLGQIGSGINDRFNQYDSRLDIMQGSMTPDLSGVYDRLGQFESRFDDRLGQIDSGINNRFGQIESRFDTMPAPAATDLSGVYDRLGQFENRFDDRLGQIENRFDTMPATDFSGIYDRLGQIDSRFDTMPVENDFRGFEQVDQFNQFDQMGENFARGGEVDMRDGSFVVDARTVSELGNGSSNAGMELLARMGGRPLQGPGDGVSDSIRARIGGKQEARVARDEVLFSPEAVKRLGKGSSKRGTAKLYTLMDRAHKARKKAKRGQDTKVRKGLA